MEKIVKLISRLVMVLGATALFAACNPEPNATYLEFSYPTFSTIEGSEKDDISVYLMRTPYKFPVVVDIKVEMLTGRNAEGEELVLDDVIEFITTDQTYTVTSTGDRTALIEGVEVTYSDYNKSIYFASKDKDFLQSETVTILFTIDKVDGSEIGSIKSTTLTIVDDEKAPLVKVGYYDTLYDAPSQAQRTDKGEFYLRLQKVGKYEYVASEFFGLSRPRLLGVFDPEKQTLTFDGTDYDHKMWAEATAEDENPFEPINAFENDTLWAYTYNEEKQITQVLRFRGAGANGTEPIVMTTEKIEENANGTILSIDTPCGFDIHSYNKGTVSPNAIGIYDSMEQSKSMTFSTTNYPTTSSYTRAAEGRKPTPFSAWRVEDINR